MLREIFKKLLGEVNLGVLDYYRFPDRGNTWGGPFNGQEIRKQIYIDIIRMVKPEAIIETGTYQGTTTKLFANENLPVLSIEGVARNYGYAKVRLRKFKNVTLYNGDSRDKLRGLFQGKLKNKKNSRLFFYLDAHWYEDLPLKEEVNIIFENCPHAVVMVDDFKVPDNTGYTYDDYGIGKSLDLEYLIEEIDEYNLAVYFPSKSSKQETGMKRGSVVLCQLDLEVNSILDGVHSLRRYCR